VWRTAVFAILVSVLWGLSDEIHQAFVPGRSSEVADFVADVVGSVAGVVGWHLFSNRTVS
jgi:VanZ family protein